MNKVKGKITSHEIGGYTFHVQALRGGRVVVEVDRKRFEQGREEGYGEFVLRIPGLDMYTQARLEAAIYRSL